MKDTVLSAQLALIAAKAQELARTASASDPSGDHVRKELALLHKMVSEARGRAQALVG